MLDEDKFNEREFKKGLKTEKMRKDNEAFKVRDGVFDKATLMTLYDLIKAEKIDTIEGIVSTGKEANVFWGYDYDENEVALKIYRISASIFRNMWQYLIQDPRFKSIKKNHRQVVFGWAKREYKNLSRLEEFVSVPHPITLRNNVLVMEFLGEDGIAYPQLKNIELDDYEKGFEAIIDSIKTMFQKGIVHADLSPYNILVGPKDKLHIIDYSQGTVIENPMSKEFLVRDIENIRNYFTRFIDTEDVRTLYMRITGEKDE